MLSPMVQIPAWSPSLSMGNDAIDRQHKVLFKLGRQLVGLLENSDADIQAFHMAINDFAESAREHFGAEEKVLARNACPTLVDHKARHDAYIDVLASTLSHNILTYRDRITLVEMVVDLVSTHVIEIDLPAREFMKDERV